MHTLIIATVTEVPGKWHCSATAYMVV